MQTDADTRIAALLFELPVLDPLLAGQIETRFGKEVAVFVEDVRQMMRLHELTFGQQEVGRGKNAAQQAPQPPRPLFWRDGPYRTVQEGGWKLIASERPKKDWLFNLNADPTEKLNLAATEPQKLAQLKAVLQAHHANMPAPLWPSFIGLPITIDKTLDQKESPQDEYTYWYN